jgi:hypothetical protein
MTENTVWASELADAQVCEQRMVFRKQYGRRETPAQQARMHEGSRAHRALLRQSLRLNPNADSSRRPSPCFIATAVFGEVAPETERFRAYRDRHLANSTAGRLFIQFYYWISPTIAAGLTRSRSSRHVARLVLLGLLALIQSHHDRRR